MKKDRAVRQWLLGGILWNFATGVYYFQGNMMMALLQGSVSVLFLLLALGEYVTRKEK